MKDKLNVINTPLKVVLALGPSVDFRLHIKENDGANVHQEMERLFVLFQTSVRTGDIVLKQKMNIVHLICLSLSQIMEIPVSNIHQ